MALVLAAGCEKKQGDSCGNPSSGCGEGLGCIFDGANVTCQPCAESGPCYQFGWCTARSGECVATKDEQCKESSMCRSHGKCVAQDGKCVATAESCRATKDCTDFGRCSARDGECVVGSDEDCRAATDCTELGKCKALVTPSSAGSCIK